MVQLNDTTTEFCNDGSAPLRVPGFSNIDYGYELPFESRFPTIFDYSYHPNVTARELAVLRVIERITDKNDWATVVLRHNIQELSAWYSEARASSILINKDAWAWIMRELYDKATSFLSSSSVLIYNTCAMSFPPGVNRPMLAGFTICKSDSQLLASLSVELQQGTTSFFSHTKRNEAQIQTGLNYQVDPAMFPLVFNKTLVLVKAGEIAKLHSRSNSVLVYGQGYAAPAVTLSEYDQGQSLEESGPERCFSKAEIYYTEYQWLPCEVEFCGDSSSDDVTITSYINNLPSGRFQHLYRTIEKLISASIQPWNQVLVNAGRGHTPLRILTFGVEYWPRRLYGRLPWVRNIDLLDNEQIRASAIDYIERFEALPFNQQQPIQARWGSSKDWRSSWRDHCNESHYVHRLHDRWSKLRSFADKHPQIGQALPYDAWKSGNINRYIIPPMDYENNIAISIPDYDFHPPAVVLQDTFRQQGLQLFVKLESIELTPAVPRYAGTDYGIEGVGNEHIVAVTIFYYSIENISEAKVSFLHRGGYWDKNDYDYDYDDFEDLAEVMALDLGSENDGVAELDNDSHYVLDGQRVGAVIARQGRMLTYPNYLSTRLEPFELHDRTRPGHLRSLRLCLVDPHYRICSTRNVAPQQPVDVFDEALEAIVPKTVILPPEIKELIRNFTENWPISTAEAVELSKHRRELPELRSKTMWGSCSC